jgi:2-desacetyl-2-hydroxyethyl bacteriochlorophyllide A dehydrogenase
MRVVELREWGLTGLVLSDRELPRPAPGTVLIRMQAASLNYRDIEILEGRYGMPVSLPIVPLSDAVGEIVEAGEGVSLFARGDRVNAVFMPDWKGGEFCPQYFQRQLGSSVPGVLQEYLALPESAIVRAPAHLTVEAAALPIAALTAWNAFRDAAIRPDQTVLIVGSGGVALFAIQLARLFGANAIVVTNTPQKIARLQQLGASWVIDGRAHPDWGSEVLKLTNGRGADVVVELGGGATIGQSTVALRVGGYVAIVGYLGGPQITIDLRSLFIGKRARLHGHTVGSRASFEEMNRAIEAHRLQPVIDSTFPIDQISQAYERARSRDTFGKVLITLG